MEIFIFKINKLNLKEKKKYKKFRIYSYSRPDQDWFCIYTYCPEEEGAPH
jgi:hypothetical protein